MLYVCLTYWCSISEEGINIIRVLTVLDCIIHIMVRTTSHKTTCLSNFWVLYLPSLSRIEKVTSWNYKSTLNYCHQWFNRIKHCDYNIKMTFDTNTVLMLPLGGSSVTAVVGLSVTGLTSPAPLLEHPDTDVPIWPMAKTSSDSQRWCSNILSNGFFFDVGSVKIQTFRCFITLQTFPTNIR